MVVERASHYNLLFLLLLLLFFIFIFYFPQKHNTLCYTFTIMAVCKLAIAYVNCHGSHSRELFV